jgi:hypothetical protein
MHVVFSRDILLLVLQCYEPGGQGRGVVEGRWQRRCWGFSRVGPCVVSIIAESPHIAVARLCLCVCSSFQAYVYLWRVCGVVCFLFVVCILIEHECKRWSHGKSGHTWEDGLKAVWSKKQVCFPICFWRRKMSSSLSRLICPHSSQISICSLFFLSDLLFFSIHT